MGLFGGGQSTSPSGAPYTGLERLTNRIPAVAAGRLGYRGIGSLVHAFNGTLGQHTDAINDFNQATQQYGEGGFGYDANGNIMPYSDSPSQGPLSQLGSAIIGQHVQNDPGLQGGVGHPGPDTDPVLNAALTARYGTPTYGPTSPDTPDEAISSANGLPLDVPAADDSGAPAGGPPANDTGAPGQGASTPASFIYNGIMNNTPSPTESQTRLGGNAPSSGGLSEDPHGAAAMYMPFSGDYVAPGEALEMHQGTGRYGGARVIPSETLRGSNKGIGGAGMGHLGAVKAR